jgi:ABC-type dipeptide/oligopeptide/nickel transport system permease component
MGLLFIGFNLLLDGVQAWLDPRHAGGEGEAA